MRSLCELVRRRLAWKYPNSPPGKASEHLFHLPALIMAYRILKVVIYCRVSSLEQYRSGNLDDQLSNVRRTLERLGVTVVGVFREIATSYELEHPSDRPALVAAVECAKQHGAIVVAESTSRYLRSAAFDKFHQDALPTVVHFERLKRLTNAAALATLVHPDAEDERSYQTKRGQTEKGRKGGRPQRKPPGYKKQQKLDLLPEVLGLHGQGASCREISREVGITPMTASRWIRQHC